MAVRGKGGNFRENVVEEAKKQGLDVSESQEQRNERIQDEWDKEDAVQKVLPGTEKPEPQVVIGDIILAEFVRPHFFMDDKERFCGLEFSITLTRSHRGKLPRSAEDAWRFIERLRCYKRVMGIEVGDQEVKLRLVSDGEVDLLLPCASIQKATVSMVKQRGKGANEKIVRFSFQAVVAATASIYTFAATQFGNQVWVEMHQAQAEIE